MKRLFSIAASIGLVIFLIGAACIESNTVIAVIIMTIGAAVAAISSTGIKAGE